MKINGKTEILGIFGDPIEHTLSPVIHNTINDELGRNSVYIPFHIDIASSTGEGAGCIDIARAVRGAYAMGIRGLNITVPFKEAVIPYLSDIDPLAEKIGAVNTLVRTEKGFKGFNTDMEGLRMAVEKSGVSLDHSRAVVLGAGGAARAVLTMLLGYGAEVVYLVNRTFEKAKLLSDEINKKFNSEIASCGRKGIIPVAADNLELIYDNEEEGWLLFQCTSLGLKKGDGLPVEDERLYCGAGFGFDLIYNPAVTPFISKLTGLGIHAENGLGMLLYQGIIAYQHWTELELSDEVVRRAEVMLKRAVYGENIVLTGYMGAGKTTAGHAIADKTGMDFIDLDEYIVSHEGKTIPQIFEAEGEVGFRRIETEALKSLSERAYNTVIALGGGAPLAEGNSDIIRRLGKVIYLYSSPEVTFERVRGDSNRPLLVSEDEVALREKIERMIRERRYAYEACMDFKVNTDEWNIDIIVDKILT